MISSLGIAPVTPDRGAGPSTLRRSGAKSNSGTASGAPVRTYRKGDCGRPRLLPCTSRLGRRTVSAVAGRLVALLLGELLPQRAQPGLDHRGQVEVAVPRFQRKLELGDRGTQVAGPGVDFGLVPVLLQPVDELRIGLRRRPVEAAVAGKAHELALEVGRRVARPVRREQ